MMGGFHSITLMDSSNIKDNPRIINLCNKAGSKKNLGAYTLLLTSDFFI
jgi:hypothetical protein